MIGSLGLVHVAIECFCESPSIHAAIEIVRFDAMIESLSAPPLIAFAIPPMSSALVAAE